MTSTQRNFLSVLLASLPVLHHAAAFRTAFFVGAWVALIFWTTSLFFKMTYHFFPKELRDLSFVLWLASWIPIGYSLVELPGLWVLSVYLLQPLAEWTNPRKTRKRKSRKGSSWNIKLFNSLFWRGLGFWIFMAGVGICGEILSTGLKLKLFIHPAGLFLILGLISLIWQQSENEASV